MDHLGSSMPVARAAGVTLARCPLRGAGEGAGSASAAETLAAQAQRAEDQDEQAEPQGEAEGQGGGERVGVHPAIGWPAQPAA